MVMALSARAHLIAFDGSTIDDPDTWMRLVRLRLIIESGQMAWSIPGADSGGPLSLHWSHLLEGMMFPFVWLLRPFLGLDGALTAVAGMVGPLGEAALAVALCWAVAPLVPTRTSRTPLGGLVSITPMLYSYGRFGVADHHVLLGAAVALVAGSALRARLRPSGRAAAMLGMTTAVGAWLSVESLVFAVMAFGGVGVAWLLGPTPVGRRRIARTLLVACMVLCAAMAAFILLDPPESGLAGVEMDRLSRPFVFAAMAGALVAAAMSAGAAAGMPARLGLLVASVALACGGWAMGFADALRVPAEVMVTASEAFDWNRISEMKPVGDLREFVVYCGLGLLGTVAATLVARRLAGFADAAYVLACGGACILLGALHIRFSVYTAVAGAAGLVIGMEYLRTHPVLSDAVRKPAMFVLGLIALCVPTGVAASIVAANDLSNDDRYLGVSCPLADVGALLRDHDVGMVLVFPNYAPELLFRARNVRVVGALYHRGTVGLAQFTRIWDAPSEEGRAAIDRLGIRWVLSCQPKEPRYGVPTDGLSLGGLLSRGTPPDWLHPAVGYRNSQPMLFEVR
ncbi:hypothetical protein AZL_001370 [Azospirillum sp. B510]|nr:hypothetical protein AZL_001370 [Azospirillum sp. B510]